MNVGFIGAGRMAQRRFVNLPAGCVPVAVYDKPGARVEQHVRADLAALHVASPNEVCTLAELVIVTTPCGYLNDYAWMAHDAGCQVFVEKPGGVPGDRPLPPGTRVGYNHRFWPGIREARAHITDAVLHIRGAYGHGHADPGDWRMKREVSGGGEFLDQGSHLIDLTRSLVGDVALSSVICRGDDVEDTAMFTLTGPRDEIAQHCVSWHEWSPIFRLEVITENEKVTVTGFPWESQTLNVTTRNGAEFQSAWGTDRSLCEELVDMLAGGPIGATGEDAIAVLRIVEEAYA